MKLRVALLSFGIAVVLFFGISQVKAEASTVNPNTVGLSEYHVIKSGDNFWNLSVRYKSTMGAIQYLNPHLSTYNLQIGEKVYLLPKVERILNDGYKYMGTPYVFGSTRGLAYTNTFDCSDYMQVIFAENGIKIPANSRTQAQFVKENAPVIKTKIEDLQRGDLMFFQKEGRVFHVGIYLGNNEILHTYSVNSGGVKINKLTNYWKNTFYFGGNVIKEGR